MLFTPSSIIWKLMCKVYIDLIYLFCEFPFFFSFFKAAIIYPLPLKVSQNIRSLSRENYHISIVITINFPQYFFFQLITERSLSLTICLFKYFILWLNLAPAKKPALPRLAGIGLTIMKNADIKALSYLWCL